MFNISDFLVNVIRLGNYKFCIRCRLSIVPFRISLAHFLSVPLSWQQQRTNIESAKLLSPHNSISALNKCKDTHILFIQCHITAITYAFPNPSIKIETEYKPQRISNIINT